MSKYHVGEKVILKDVRMDASTRLNARKVGTIQHVTEYSGVLAQYRVKWEGWKQYAKQETTEYETALTASPKEK